MSEKGALEQETLTPSAPSGTLVIDKYGNQILDYEVTPTHKLATSEPITEKDILIVDSVYGYKTINYKKYLNWGKPKPYQQDILDYWNKYKQEGMDKAVWPEPSPGPACAKDAPKYYFVNSASGEKKENFMSLTPAMIKSYEQCGCGECVADLQKDKLLKAKQKPKKPAWATKYIEPSSLIKKAPIKKAPDIVARTQKALGVLALQSHFKGLVPQVHLIQDLLNLKNPLE